MTDDTAILVPEPRGLERLKPTAEIAYASEIATELEKIIEVRKLYSNISGKKHVAVEGWTTLAALRGCTAREVSNVQDPDRPGVYIATVELVNSEGRAIGVASAECGADDEIWSKRQAFARRSMANTRATSKVCRQVFSWIMVLAGYDATPAEEMRDLDKSKESAPKQQQQQTARPPQQNGSREWDGELRFKTGKNKGKRWADVDSGFLDWAMNRGGDLGAMATKEIARRAKLEGQPTQTEFVDAEPVDVEEPPF